MAFVTVDVEMFACVIQTRFATLTHLMQHVAIYGVFDRHVEE